MADGLTTIGRLGEGLFISPVTPGGRDRRRRGHRARVGRRVPSRRARRRSAPVRRQPPGPRRGPSDRHRATSALAPPAARSGRGRPDGPGGQPAPAPTCAPAGRATRPGGSPGSTRRAPRVHPHGTARSRPACTTGSRRPASRRRSSATCTTSRSPTARPSFTRWPRRTTHCAAGSPSCRRVRASSSPPSTATWPSWRRRESTSASVTPRAWSVLEDWTECPFAYFVHHLLGVREIDDRTRSSRSGRRIGASRPRRPRCRHRGAHRRRRRPRSRRAVVGPCSGRSRCRVALLVLRRGGARRGRRSSALAVGATTPPARVDAFLALDRQAPVRSSASPLTPPRWSSETMCLVHHRPSRRCAG